MTIALPAVAGVHVVRIALAEAALAERRRAEDAVGGRLRGGGGGERRQVHVERAEIGLRGRRAVERHAARGGRRARLVRLLAAVALPADARRAREVLVARQVDEALQAVGAE